MRGLRSREIPLTHDGSDESFIGDLTVLLVPGQIKSTQGHCCIGDDKVVFDSTLEVSYS